MEQKIKQIVEKLFEKMLFFDMKIEVKKIEYLFEVNIDTEEPGMLIGKNGETLRALESLLRLILSKEFEEPINISIDIAGYKNKRKQEIEEMGVKAAQSATRTGRVQLLMPMNAYERRIVHMVLAKMEDIETESVGAEPNRRVMIKTKKKALV